MKLLFQWMSVCVLLGGLSIGLLACGDPGEQPNVTDAGDRLTIGDPIDDAEIAAVVTSEFGADTLRMSEFQARWENVSRNFPQAITDGHQADMVRANMMEQFVERHLLVQEAARRGIEPDEVELEAQLSNLYQQFPDEESYRQFLAGNEMTEEEVRRQMGEQLSIQTLIEQLADGVPEPDADDVEQFRMDQAREVRARHILFRSNGEGAGDARELAEAVLDSIKAGADFEELARRHSDDPGSAAQGGDLGFFPRGAMVQAFEEAVFSLEEGEVTAEPVQTTYGYHIIQMVESREDEPVDVDQAAEILKSQQQQEHVMGEIESLKGSATLYVNPSVVDPDRLRDGGDLAQVN